VKNKKRYTESPLALKPAYAQFIPQIGLAEFLSGVSGESAQGGNA
jgi:hypothetical protein